jgi:toxin ParE1/3/4
MASSELRVRVSRRAQADIRRIYVYTATHWNIDQADRYQRQIGSAFHELAQFPAIGIERPDIARGIRSWVIGSHVVLYPVRDDEIVISRLVQTRQDPGTPNC